MSAQVPQKMRCFRFREKLTVIVEKLCKGLLGGSKLCSGGGSGEAPILFLVKKMVIEGLSDICRLFEDGRPKVFVGEGDNKVTVGLELVEEAVLLSDEVELGWFI